jgi:TRAP-type uncharacterized transport system fused permease subunit
VLLSVLHSAFLLVMGWIVMFGCNSRQTRQLVPTTIMVICEIFECYCEHWKQISRCCWGFMMAISFYWTNTPISKYCSPLYCALLVFIVVVFVFILFGVVLQVYGTRCVMLKLCYKIDLHELLQGFDFKLWISKFIKGKLL